MPKDSVYTRMIQPVPELMWRKLKFGNICSESGDPNLFNLDWIFCCIGSFQRSARSTQSFRSLCNPGFILVLEAKLDTHMDCLISDIIIPFKYNSQLTGSKLIWNVTFLFHRKHSVFVMFAQCACNLYRQCSLTNRILVEVHAFKIFMGCSKKVSKV